MTFKGAKALGAVCILLALLGFHCKTAVAPTKPTMKEPHISWSAVDSLEAEGLPKSALEEVLRIKQTAASRQAWAQYIKAIVYENKFRIGTEEDGWIKSIVRMENELSKLPEPARSVLHSYLGEAVGQYLMANHWTISQRQTRANSDDDIATMSVDALQRKALEHYRASLAWPGLRESSLEQFDVLISAPDTSSDRSPWLYPLLARRQLDFLSTHHRQAHQPLQAFQVDKEVYFAPARDFINLTFQTPDSLSFDRLSLILYRDIIQFHHERSEIAEATRADLRRLQFAFDRGANLSKERLHRMALARLMAQVKDLPISTAVAHRWSLAVQGQGDSISLVEAHRICQEALERFPDAPDAGLCHGRIAEIERKHLSIVAEEVNIPGENMLLKVHYRNHNQLHLKVVRLEESEVGQYERLAYDDRLPFLHARPQVHSDHLELALPVDYREHTTEVKLPGLPAGYYVILVGSDAQLMPEGQAVRVASLRVSQLAYAHLSGSGSPSLVVFDRQSGWPLPGVQVQWYTQHYDSRRGLTTHQEIGRDISDEDGLVSLPSSGRHHYYVRLSLGDDWLSMGEGYSSYQRPSQPRHRSAVNFFTDRAIYRPGQPLHFKGLLIDFEEGMPRIAPEEDVTITLYDGNGQAYETLSLQSNAFGSVSGTFTLPTVGLRGSMSLGSDRARDRHPVRVEEYKRPTFKVSFDTLPAVVLGDTVEVSGEIQSYAGVPLSGVPASFRVVRKTQFPFRPWWGFRMPFPQGPDKEIAQGVVSSDQGGKFTLRFVAGADQTIDREMRPIFTFEIWADATDINGETQTGRQSIQAGYEPFVVHLDLESSYRLGELSTLPIQALSYQQVPIDVRGSVRVQRLRNPSSWKRPRHWAMPDQPWMTPDDFAEHFPMYDYATITPDQWEMVDERVVAFDAGRKPEIDLADVLSGVGYYRITCAATDSQGRSVTVSKTLHLDDPHSDFVPSEELLVARLDQDTYQPGDTVELTLGVAMPGRILLQEDRRQAGPGLKWVDVQRWSKQSIVLTEQDRGGLYLHVFFAYSNRTVSRQIHVPVPWTNKELDVSITRINNKIQPGSPQEIELKIAGPGGEALAAELVLGMYDASLDAFVPHRWQAQLFTLYSATLYSRAVGFGTVHDQGFQEGWNPTPKGATYYNPPQLRWFRYPLQGRRFMRAMEDGIVAPMTAEAVPPDVQESLSDASAKSSRGPVESAVAIKDVPVRSDFAETVFFYPHLRTNAQGEVVVTFTANDALTTWRLLAFAHSVELASGLQMAEVISQKDLMVTTNQPRFLRVGDRIELSAKIDHLLDHSTEGIADLELRDALTEEVLTSSILRSSQKQHFRMEAGGSARVSWTLQIPTGLRAPLEYRIRATSGYYADAEQGLIPILENRKLVTETLVMHVRGGTQRQYAFDRMRQHASPTLEHESYTIEYTSHPIWHAIKALPYLMENPYECTEQVFNRLYANTLGAHIVESFPRVENTLKAWAQEGDLQSPLVTNPTLKSALIEETPWVAEAAEEKLQQQRLAWLFDRNRMNAEWRQLSDRLVQYQNSDGGFPWFPGGRSHVFITQYLLEGIARLQGFDRPLEWTTGMVAQAIPFLDAEVARYYWQIEKNVSKGNTTWTHDHLNATIIHYAFVRQMYLTSNPLPGHLDKIWSFLMDQLERHWLAQPLYSQGLISLTLQRSGLDETAATLLASFKERLLVKPDLGAYWPYEYGMRWYQLPIETHTLMIEVFDELDGDASMTDELRLWLLNHKRTNRWESTKATAAAVSVLTRTERGWPLDQQSVTIKLGAESLPSEALQAGTLYGKTRIEGRDIKAEMADIAVSNPNQGVMWGAAYWQYFEDLEKIEASGDHPMRIDKSIFRKRLTERGPVLEQANDLTPGDELVVRLVIETDRDIEFVHIKDQRCAGLEPMQTLSKYHWQSGLGYYMSAGDLATDFFVDWLPRGKHVLEYGLRVSQGGDFSAGVATMQSMYAPEFAAHSGGTRMVIGQQQ